MPIKKDPSGGAAPPGGFKTGGWYGGYQYWNGSFAPKAGVFHPQSGQGSGAAPVAQQDKAFIDQQNLQADQIQSPTPISLPSSTQQEELITGISAEVDKTKSALEDYIATQKAEVDAKVATLREKEKNILEQDIKPLVSPFREDLEKTERERLFIDKNFQENQVLINELDQLLTEGNELIRQQKEVTGLAAVRNPRIQKSMDDVAARAGVIQAVINARNGQIAVAENMIDRTINAIAADRNDQISYYETILNLNRQDIISLDKDSKKMAEEQLNIKKFDLENANKTATLLKEMMIDPAKAQLIGQAGVKLTDTVEEVNKKLARASYAVEVAELSNSMVEDGAQPVISPKGVPKDELRVLTDSKGKKHYFRVKEKKTGSGSGTASERMASKAASVISNNSMNFPDVVVNFANQMSLPEIYSAYIQSEMGQKFGLPAENANEIALLYKWARGEITENEYKAKMGV